MLATKTRISAARILSSAIVAIRSNPYAYTERGGLRWNLDLREGIDLAIYLGIYQKITKRVAHKFIPRCACAIDVGANIGSHTLQLARLIGPEGRVVAVEPTGYAFQKLTENIRANPPAIADTVVPVQAALGGGDGEIRPPAFYSRWPLTGSEAGRHFGHCGQLEDAADARFLTFDTLVAELRAGGLLPKPVSFVKIDVDGHELEVLQGAFSTLKRERPVIQIEIAPYVQDEVSGRFENLLQTLAELGYRLESLAGHPLPGSAEALRKYIGFGASMDAIAVPC